MERTSSIAEQMQMQMQMVRDGLVFDYVLALAIV